VDQRLGRVDQLAQGGDAPFSCPRGRRAHREAPQVGLRGLSGGRIEGVEELVEVDRLRVVLADRDRVAEWKLAGEVPWLIWRYLRPIVEELRTVIVVSFAAARSTCQASD